MRASFEHPWPGLKELTVQGQTFVVTGRTHPVDLGEHLRAAYHLMSENGERHVFYVGTDWTWCLYRLATVKSYPMSGGGTFLVAEGDFTASDAPDLRQARLEWTRRYFVSRANNGEH